MTTKPRTSPPHGVDVFNFNRVCECTKCKPRRDAIRSLVDSFSHIPSRWIEELADKRGDYLPLPMWGTLFVPKDSVDIRNINRLLTTITATNEEEKAFAIAGWQEIDSTGIFGLDFDDELLLGIHGAGYDFYTQHWAKLYDAMDYRWHEAH